MFKVRFRKCDDWCQWHWEFWTLSIRSTIHPSRSVSMNWISLVSAYRSTIRRETRTCIYTHNTHNAQKHTFTHMNWIMSIELIKFCYITEPQNKLMSVEGMHTDSLSLSLCPCRFRSAHSFNFGVNNLLNVFLSLLRMNVFRGSDFTVEASLWIAFLCSSDGDGRTTETANGWRG